MPSLRVADETLHYERAGSGPPLVLVHSLGTSAALWAEQIAHWRHDYDVIAMDARGHGRSTNVGGFGIQAVASDLLALLDHLGVLPAHFVGISMGGLICSRLHEMRPDAMRSLVIAGSFASLGDIGPQRAAALETRIRTMPLADYGRIYAQETLLEATPRAKHDWLAASIGAMTQDSYLQTVRAIYAEDVRAAMRGMRMPVRIIVGDQDQRTPLRLSQDIVALVPDAELCVLADAAHLSNLDNPRAFHGAVDSFLERVEERVN